MTWNSCWNRGVRKNEIRDERICFLRKEGYTLIEIGKMFGLTRERIRQIVNEERRWEVRKRQK